MKQQLGSHAGKQECQACASRGLVFRVKFLQSVVLTTVSRGEEILDFAQ